MVEEWVPFKINRPIITFSFKEKFTKFKKIIIQLIRLFSGAQIDKSISEMEKSIVFYSYPKLDLDFKHQSLDSKNLVWEPQAARGSRPGPGAGLETPIFGFE
jgi:hypothetical protein